MKTSKFLVFTLLVSVLFFSASCNKEDAIGPDKAEASSITIKLGDNHTKANGTTTGDIENAVKSFTVYIFYPNGALEKAETVTSGLEKQISGLTAGTKKIAVLANIPAGYPTITSYGAFENAMFDLGTQDPATIETTGLTMSGENDNVTLAPGDGNTLTLFISRIVAKIQLGSITISPDAGHEASKFALVALHIMKARATSNMGIPAISTGSNFYGGRTGDVSTTAKTYLTEDISAGHANRYFYVFPNDNTDGNATLMTIEGTYDGTTVYFPFRINDKIVEEGDGSGEYIKRNTNHLVNVTLKKLNGGTADPEEPADPASITVTIVPQDWTPIPVQEVEW